MWVYKKLHIKYWNNWSFIFRCGWFYSHVGFLYERVETPNILSRFVVGRPEPEYGLPVAVLYERVDRPNILSYFVVGRPGPEYGLAVAVKL